MPLSMPCRGSEGNEEVKYIRSLQNMSLVEILDLTYAYVAVVFSVLKYQVYGTYSTRLRIWHAAHNFLLFLRASSCCYVVMMKTLATATVER